MSSGNVHRFECEDGSLPPTALTPEGAIPTPPVTPPADGTPRIDGAGACVMADPPFWRMIGKRNDREAWRDRSL